MTTLQEAAMHKALDALEGCAEYTALLDDFTQVACREAIESLRTALAQQGEPVVLAHDNCRAGRMCRTWCGNSACVSHTAVPAAQLVTSQPRR